MDLSPVPITPENDPNSRFSQQPVPVVYVQGTHYEMGRQIGQHRSTAIHAMLATYRRHFEADGERLRIRSWREATLHARKYLPFAEESVPQYVAELQGMADGAEIDFNDLLVLNCMEALTEDALHRGCTSLAAAPEVTADGRLLVGHNEDWLPDDFETVYLVHARPASEPAYLAITYGGLLPNIGFNECGIAQCCDSVYPNDARIGVPRIFVSRASFPTPGEGEFYWVDLIGLRVVNRQHRVLGTVDGLIETGPHCVLSLRGEDPARRPTLIPFVDAYVDRVDREHGVIEVDWGEDD